MNFEHILIEKLTKSCDEKVVKSEAEWEDYNKRVSDLIFKTASTFESTPGAGSIPGSREASPHRVQRRYVNVKHLLPNTLGEECTTSEYRKFVREFNIWVNTAYPGGYSNGEMWGTLNSRLAGRIILGPWMALKKWT